MTTNSGAAATRVAPGRVLVVDDDEDSRTVLTHLLERQGYQVVSADGGHAAIDVLARELVDVVLLDVMMPRMDGFAVCRELKQSERTSALPVILITAKDDMETRATGMKLGVSDFIAKPVNKTELLNRVETQVNTRRRSDELDRAKEKLDSLS